MREKPLKARKLQGYWDADNDRDYYSQFEPHEGEGIPYPQGPIETHEEWMAKMNAIPKAKR